jgi:hypothetical protein
LWSVIAPPISKRVTKFGRRDFTRLARAASEVRRNPDCAVRPTDERA